MAREKVSELQKGLLCCKNTPAAELMRFIDSQTVGIAKNEWINHALNYCHLSCAIVSDVDEKVSNAAVVDTARRRRSSLQR